MCEIEWVGIGLIFFVMVAYITLLQSGYRRCRQDMREVVTMLELIKAGEIHFVGGHLQSAKK